MELMGSGGFLGFEMPLDWLKIGWKNYFTIFVSTTGKLV